MAKHERTDFDYARDELMSHIHRCGVLKASVEHQAAWLDETMEYMSERYSGLKTEEISELQEIGKRFCQPVISNVTEQVEEESEREEESQREEMAGAAAA